jgi:hypothetical protein
LLYFRFRLRGIYLLVIIDNFGGMGRAPSVENSTKFINIFFNPSLRAREFSFFLSLLTNLLAIITISSISLNQNRRQKTSMDARFFTSKANKKGKGWAS